MLICWLLGAPKNEFPVFNIHLAERELSLLLDQHLRRARRRSVLRLQLRREQRQADRSLTLTNMCDKASLM